METVLNLLWLSIAVAATTRFAIRAAREPDLASPQRRRVAATALVCVIFLLFPIISVTDDLHEDAALVEETSGPRRVSAAHPTRSAGHGLSPAVLCARATLMLGLLSLYISEVPAAEAYIAPAAILAPPRGPPLSRR